MDELKKRIKVLIKELVTELNKLGQIKEYNQVKPKAHPPATLAQIDSYEKKLGIKLPNSYKAFLELYNGYDWLAYPGHMLSIQDVMPGGNWYEEIVDWKKTSAEYGSGEVLDGIVIANLGQLNDWVYIDPNKPSEDGELTVVEWTPEDSEEYPNLLDFLTECLETCKYALEEENNQFDISDDDLKDEQ